MEDMGPKQIRLTVMASAKKMARPASARTRNLVCLASFMQAIMAMMAITAIMPKPIR